MRRWAGVLVGMAACGGGVDDLAAVTDVAPPAVEVEGAATPDAAVAAWTATPAIGCQNPADSIYDAPFGLGEWNDAARGEPTRCAMEQTFDQAGVAAELGAAGVGGVEAVSGVKIYRIAYRTRQADGTEASSSARVWLPTEPVRVPVPVVVIAHPSQGVADACAITRTPGTPRDGALPVAARGYAVIAPDFSGLGGDGVQQYLDNHEQGFQTLDAARALRKLVAAGLVADEVLLVGYSQGGGAVLSAQGLAGGDGDDGLGTVRGVIALAAQWPSRVNSFDYMDLLQAPEQLTIFTGLSYSVVAVLRQYAWFARHRGEGGLAFSAAKRGALVDAIESQCLIELGGTVQTTLVHLGDLIDESLRAGLVSCESGGACTGDAAAYWQFLQANVVHGDASGAPVLYVQGLADQIMPAAKEAACNVGFLRGDGVDVQVCADTWATHASVLGAQIGFMVQWGEAVLGGAARPVCDNDVLPACDP